MKNVLSYINRPLFGAEIKSWIAENTKQNTAYSRIARSMLRYMNLRNDTAGKRVWKAQHWETNRC